VKQDSVPVRAYLLHLTHYSPVWCLHKRRERAIDLTLALEIIDAIAKADFNLLMVDCADGLIYRSHPELRRHYSIPRSSLTKLLDYARKRKIELVPKLNFSQSIYHRHNYWFRPYHKLFDNTTYWTIGFELIDELIEIFQPKRFVHIGMDEDDKRTHVQYSKAIRTLREGLKKRGLRSIIWNDTARGGSKPWHARKSLVAEKSIPKDIVQIIWDYQHVRPAVLRRVVDEGFDVWIAPSQKPQHVVQWKKAVLKYGGGGMVMTTWMPCRSRNRSTLLDLIQTVGPIYSARL
jgi:hypothetical protein